MNTLITAFEPFGGEPVNPAWEAVKRLNAPEGMSLTKLLVPTVFGRAAETVLAALRREQPDYVLCVGQAAGRAAITPERVAINLRDASLPDNAGQQPVDQPIVLGGAAAFFATLPIKAMVRAMENAGVPAAISNSAGTFVCNDLMYTVLYHIETEFPGVRGGFVHVPCLPEQAERMKASMPAMPLAQIVTGLETALTALRESE